MRNRYAHIKQGRRPDLGDTFYRSGWEANYQRYLNFLLQRKIIYKSEHEPTTFWFHEIKRGVRSYLPDFKVWEFEDEEPFYVEVKGHMDSRSATKIKRMKKYYPHIKLVLVGKKEYKALDAQFAGLIKYWE